MAAASITAKLQMTTYRLFIGKTTKRVILKTTYSRQIDKQGIQSEDASDGICSLLPFALRGQG